MTTNLQPRKDPQRLPRRMAWVLVVLSVAVALGLVYCTADMASRPATAPSPSTTSRPLEPPYDMTFAATNITLKGKAFSMEVAESRAQIERGLMYRDSMPADHGMIFVLDKPDRPNFWMKNTRIPLDIIFLDKAGKVLVIHRRLPFDETGMGPDEPAQYVIELNADTAKKIGLARGDVVEIPKKYLKSGPASTEK